MLSLLTAVKRQMVSPKFSKHCNQENSIPVISPPRCANYCTQCCRIGILKLYLMKISMLLNLYCLLLNGEKTKNVKMWLQNKTTWNTSEVWRMDWRLFFWCNFTGMAVNMVTNKALYDHKSIWELIGAIIQQYVQLYIQKLRKCDAYCKTPVMHTVQTIT